MITSLIGVVGTTLFLAGPWFAALLIGRTPAVAVPAPAPRTLTTVSASGTLVPVVLGN